MKICRKKICAKYSSYIYKQFGFVWYNLKHSGMQRGTLQSGDNHTVSFLYENSKIKTNSTLTARTAEHNVTVNSWLCSFLSFFI
jgi:S-adenosylmethionine hydrolase